MASTHNYRNDARNALRRAVVELGSADEDRLRYAALELRAAIECLAYERVLLYIDELPKDAIHTWQPKQVMDTLLALDPQADKSRSIAVAPESTPGVRSGPFTALGLEVVLSIGQVKKHYARLGSYLHPPTIGQVESGRVTSPARMREHCGVIAKAIESILASPVFNVNLRRSATLECPRCNNPIIRRIPSTATPIEARCPNCNATFSLSVIEGNKVDWHPIGEEVACHGPSCGEPIFVWQDEITPGTNWHCAKCGGHNRLALGVIFEPCSSRPQDDEPSRETKS